MRVLRTDRPQWQGSWADQAHRCVEQEPLFDTQASVEGLRQASSAARPRTIFLGVGICARGELSQAVPIDLLGMILPAEALRRTLHSQELLVVVADSHALANGFDPEQVEARARAVEQVLQRVRTECRLPHLRVRRASELHQSQGYRRMLLQVRWRAGQDVHEYLLQQFADALYLHQTQGPLLKVGWSLPSADPLRQRDEVSLDRLMSERTGAKLPCVYCKPARTLADAAPRMPPYVVKRPDSRLCLDRGGDQAGKLSAARHRAKPSTVAGFRRHVRHLVYTWGRLVDPLPRGPLEQRVAALIARFGPLVPGPGESD